MTVDLSGARIGVDARYLRHPGMGIHRYTLDLLAALAEARAGVTLLVNAPLPAGPHGEQVVVLPGDGIAWEQWTLLRHLRANRYDAYLAPANRGIPLLYRGPATTAVTVHDLIPMLFPRAYLWRRWRYAASYLASQVIAARRADLVFAVSAATARDVGRLLRRPALVAPNRLPAAIATAAPRPVDRPYFLYNGGRDRRKRVDVLLEAFALARRRLPAHRLVLMGKGYEALRPEIDRLAIADAVTLTGYVSEAEKAGYLAHAAALVYPSMYEGYGLPVVEAFAAGVPVVTGTGGALAELGGDAALYADPADPEAVAAAMLRATEPGTAAGLIARGRARLAGLAASDGPTSLLARVSATLPPRRCAPPPPSSTSR